MLHLLTRARQSALKLPPGANELPLSAGLRLKPLRLLSRRGRKRGKLNGRSHRLRSPSLERVPGPPLAEVLRFADRCGNSVESSDRNHYRRIPTKPWHGRQKDLRNQLHSFEPEPIAA